MKTSREFIHQWLWVVLIAFCIVGLFYPAVGIAALICMLAPSVAAIWKDRFWCGSFCPRGSFNDSVLRRISFKRPLPKLLKSKWFRYLFLVLLMSAFAVQLTLAWGSLESTGLVFVRMIIITTLVTIILGIFYSHRTWCVICPMGTMASLVTRAAANSPTAKTNKKVAFVRERCVSCKLCSKSCPVGIDVLSYKGPGKVLDHDCLKCNECVYKCPKNSLTKV
ncbi:electron transport complex subunit RsxB [Ruminiclostridium hungatei]|uniref:Electron transport complex subunit RsxB n=1 Tax=Ruminiclostridium hungatei TaxID=48256 RepID=A0A1V4SJ76_RUMHU|nr:4Fe-4S binding protein [Ruminiclostridium hungatei]OPX43297.1 electron transport complex subunit RsxB [Ruminiclostridium hungatei]